MAGTSILTGALRYDIPEENNCFSGTKTIVFVVCAAFCGIQTILGEVRINFFSEICKLLH